jgi:hypothetical protein
MARLHNVSFVRSFRAAFVLPPVNGALEEMSTWVLACGIDVVVLRILAHFANLAETPD